MQQQLFKIASALVLSLTLASCGEEKQSLPPRGSTLKVLTAADYPPFERYNKIKNKTPEMIGYDIDLVKRIGQYLSYEVEFIDYDFADVIPTLTQHKAHLAIAAINVTPGRQKQITFSKPYYNARNILLLPLGSPLIRDDDFTNLHIAVKRGSTQEQFAKVWKQKHKGIKLVSFQQDHDVVQAVISKGVDAAIVEETPGRAYIQTNVEALTYRLLEDDNTKFAIAFPKGSPLVSEFNKALEHLESIGEIDKLKQKWFVG
ncbi:MAG: transporter substrate-binding domain-containing protein [Pseudomonadota bacterium]